MGGAILLGAHRARDRHRLPRVAVTATILLLSVNEAAMLEHSLPAALAQDPVPEVVVVDNASNDGTAQLADRHGVRHLRLPTQLSYAAALNRAIAATGGEFVLLLNAD